MSSLLFIGYNILRISLVQVNNWFKCSTKYKLSISSYADFCTTTKSNFVDNTIFPRVELKFVKHWRLYEMTNFDEIVFLDCSFMYIYWTCPSFFFLFVQTFFRVYFLNKQKCLLSTFLIYLVLTSKIFFQC